MGRILCRNWYRPAFVLVLAVLVVVPALSPGARTEDEPAQPKAAVRQLLDDQVAAWNKGDLRGFLNTYWRSDKLRFYSGKEITRGWDATLARYEKRYRAEGKEMGRLTFSDVEVEMLGPGVGWVRGRWQLVTSKETLSGLYTLIVKKLPEGWRIVHDHTSV
jgi:beta-aspartyl-peptidase (threonine type)